MIDIQILPVTLSVQACIGTAMCPGAGGIDIFVGTVRDTTKDKRVMRLEFEAYEKMAVSEMNEIAGKALATWALYNIVIHHRTGILQVGEIAVVIAVSAAHRADAFDACRYIIDTLKNTVPIWKKEVFEDGEVWVAAHP